MEVFLPIAQVFINPVEILLLSAIAITVATFETAKRKPSYFGNYYTPSRSRAIYVDGKRIELDPNDRGGEHE